MRFLVTFLAIASVVQTALAQGYEEEPDYTQRAASDSMWNALYMDEGEAHTAQQIAGWERDNATVAFATATPEQHMSGDYHFYAGMTAYGLGFMHLNDGDAAKAEAKQYRDAAEAAWNNEEWDLATEKYSESIYSMWTATTEYTEANILFYMSHADFSDAIFHYTRDPMEP